MKKLITTVIGIILALTMLLAIGCNGDVDTFKNEFDIDHSDLGVAPEDKYLQGTTRIDSSKVTKTSEELTDDSDVIATATYLFNLADSNLESVEFYASLSHGSGVATITNMNMAGSMQVREARVKDGAEMYMVSMGRVVDGYLTGNSSSSVSTIISMCRAVLDYGNRVYTPDGKTFYRQKSGTKALDKNCVDNFYTQNTYIDWSKADKVTKTDYATFMAENFYDSHYAEANGSKINTDTIKQAKVVFNEALGIYEIEMIVDTSTDALELSTASIRDSAGSNDIVYTHQTIKCEIWTSGMFRMYHTADGWSGTLASILKGSSENLWTKYFTYNKDKATQFIMPTSEELTWTNI